MGLQIGIVGLPNVGKSTIFNALTGNQVAAENYPFCTIDPNVGVVTVPDLRLKKIAEFLPRLQLIPTAIEFVDIAGLVKGASQGEGLGNQFLGHIRNTDAILQIVRCFEDSNVIHVHGEIEPIRDIDIIETEFLLADLDVVEKRNQKIEKAAISSQDKKLKFEHATTQKVLAHLKLGKSARLLELTEPELEIVKTFALLTMKPILYVCNVNENDFAKGGNQWFEMVKNRSQQESNMALMVCGALEAEIATLPENEQKDFLQTLGTNESGLIRVINESYRLLSLETFFTFNKNEIRAWTIKKGTKAPQAAGVIHSDFERGFIRAEVFHCTDLFEYKTEAAIREHGKHRSEGKDYVVKDGDIILFRFNV